MMVGVMHPDIIGIEDTSAGRTYSSHGKGAPRGECRVRGKGSGFKLCYFSDYLIRVSDEARSLVPNYGEICGKDSGVLFPFYCAQNGFECRARFLYKLAEQSIAASMAAKVAGMPDEESSRSLSPLIT